MKSFIIYALLITFGLVSTPKQWWHTHEIEGFTSKNQSLSLDTEYHSDDCSYCDFDLSQVIVPMGFVGLKVFDFDTNVVKQAILGLASTVNACVQLRGPPNNYCA